MHPYCERCEELKRTAALVAAGVVANHGISPAKIAEHSLEIAAAIISRAEVNHEVHPAPEELIKSDLYSSGYAAPPAGNDLEANSASDGAAAAAPDPAEPFQP